MVKYRCEDCGAVSAEPTVYREVFGEERAACPTCGAPVGEDYAACEVCGEVAEGESALCARCGKRICREQADEVAAWLQSVHGRLGWFSWEDFLLGEVYGVVDCRNTARLTAVLPVPSGVALGDALWRYFCADADSFRALAEWIGGRL
ncbi:MAG: hypothetical protein IKU55_03195 [Clostridia bacterium]|nr:hypothetical protein [Clostridia bacterium]